MNLKKKIACISLSFICALILLPNRFTSVKAANPYRMNCSNFEMALAKVDSKKQGYFEKVGCYASFDAAKSVMKEKGHAAVVRHSSMDSSNKIIAMNTGVVYTDVSSSHLALLKMVGHSGHITYARSNRMAFYHDTFNYDNGHGDVWLTLSGFKGTTDIHNLEFVPMVWMNNGTYSYVNGASVTKEVPYFSAYTSQGCKEILFTAKDQVGNTYFNAAFGIAPSWMKENKRYYSSNDIDFYEDPQLTKYSGTYYNYYQFLPLRTKSKIPASKYNEFLKKMGKNSSSKLWNTGDLFVKAQEHFGLNALMVFSQACVESAYGNSYLATNRNNLFGWKAYDSNPNGATGYTSVKQCIDQAFRDNIRDYVSTNEPVYYGEHFGNKGSGITMKYASSTTYGLTVAAVAYSFDKFAGLVDHQSVHFGVLKDKNVNVYNQPSNKANVLYKAGYGMDNASPYYNNHVVAVLGTFKDYYKIQSTDYHDGSKVITSRNNHSDRAYDWNQMIGYVKKSDLQLVTDSDKKTGWVDKNGKKYWFNEKGKPEPGWKTIQGNRYWFHLDGRAETGWSPIDGKIYHFGPDGKMDSGWFSYKGHLYYLNTIEDGHMETGWARIAGYKYHFGSDGKLDTGWFHYGGNTYYLDPKSNGRMVTGKVTIDGKDYVFGEDGVLVQKNGWKQINGKKYWFNEKGKPEPGWKDIDGKRYWFHPDGQVETGWRTIEGKKYHFNDAGELDYGWFTYQGNQYYLNPELNGATQTGWKEIESELYWFYPDGKMETGWSSIAGEQYHFKPDGRLDTGWFEYKGNRYYLDPKSKGRMVKGLFQINQKTYYFDEKGWMKNDGWHTINGHRYRFTVEGYAETGWKMIDGHKYWFFNDGRMETGWAMIKGKKYHFAPDGKMDTKWFEYQGSKYYLNTDGHAETGWDRIDGKMYWFNSDGRMETGFRKIAGKVYNFGRDGVMLTYWQMLSNKRYYFNQDGHMETGWARIDGKMYWFNPDGHVETGWARIGGKLYHFAPDGKMDMG